VGTTVTSYFPLVTNPVDTPAPAASCMLDGSENDSAGRGDVAVREFAERCWNRTGTRYLRRGMSPRRLPWNDHAGPIHLLLSDVVMPD